MTVFLQDLRHAARMLGKSPGFTLLALAMLAMGIGANTAIFSVVDAVLLRPLPYPDADRIVTIGEMASNEDPRHSSSTSYANFLDWKAQSSSFQAMTIFNGWRPALTGLGEAERLRAAFVTAEVFDILGVRPERGRAIRPEENAPNAPNVAVVSHGFWQRRLGGDPAAVGRTITLNAQPFTVIGVLPAGFRAAPAEIDVEVWANNSPDPRDSRTSRYLRVMGKLKPGVTLSRARAEMKAISARLEAAYPKDNDKMAAGLLPLRRAMTTDTRAPLLLLAGAAGLLLLIACANLGNLLVARGVARAPEFAVRVALGASRWRIARQLLTESLALAGVGGAVGLLLAPWGTQLLLALAPESVRTSSVHTDARVLVFALLASAAASLLAGLVPVVPVSADSFQANLKEAGRSGRGARGHRIRNGLAVAQLALALTLAALAGLLARSFERAQNVEPGIRPENLWTLSVNIPESRYPKPRQPQFFDALAERAAALPGVAGAAVSSDLPFSGNWDRISVAVEGRPGLSPSEQPEGDRYIVSPGYFAVMGIPLKSGRVLEETDRYDSPLVAVVDERFARRLSPSGSAIGTRLKLPARDGFAEVVGVVGHVKHYGLDAESQGQIYMSHRQYPWRWMHLVVRASTSGGSLAGPLAEQVRALDADVPVFDVATMEQLMADRFATRRFATLLASVFAGAALSLAALGLFGLVAYVAAQRMRELAIRIALGAQPADIRRLVLGQGFRLGLAGTTVGLAGAAAGGRLASGLLFQTGPADPIVLSAVVAPLLAVTLLASALPALRASRTDPIAALRAE